MEYLATKQNRFLISSKNVELKAWNLLFRTFLHLSAKFFLFILYIYLARICLSVRPAQISIWTNPNQRCDHASITIGESSGSQCDLLLVLSVGMGGRSAIVWYLGSHEVNFSESRQIAYLAFERPIFTPKKNFNPIFGQSATVGYHGPLEGLQIACLGPKKSFFNKKISTL